MERVQHPQGLVYCPVLRHSPFSRPKLGPECISYRLTTTHLQSLPNITRAVCLMPRLPTSLIRRARNQDPLLVPLLKICRDLPSAQSELRWIGEHASSVVHREEDDTTLSARTRNEREDAYVALKSKLCHDRGRGRPLQYVLGSTPFGPLDLSCRPGVLIPRYVMQSSCWG